MVEDISCRGWRFVVLFLFGFGCCHWKFYFFEWVDSVAGGCSIINESDGCPRLLFKQRVDEFREVVSDDVIVIKLDKLGVDSIDSLKNLGQGLRLILFVE